MPICQQSEVTEISYNLLAVLKCFPSQQPAGNQLWCFKVDILLLFHYFWFFLVHFVLD